MTQEDFIDGRLLSDFVTRLIARTGCTELETYRDRSTGDITFSDIPSWLASRLCTLLEEQAADDGCAVATAKRKRQRNSSSAVSTRAVGDDDPPGGVLKRFLSRIVGGAGTERLEEPIDDLKDGSFTAARGRRISAPLPEEDGKLSKQSLSRARRRGRRRTKSKLQGTAAEKAVLFPSPKTKAIVDWLWSIKKFNDFPPSDTKTQLRCECQRHHHLLSAPELIHDQSDKRNLQRG